MTRREGRRRTRGSQSLELVAVLPLLTLVAGFACQAVVLVREQSEAEVDARALARISALCPHPSEPPRIDAVDDAQPDADVLTTSEADRVAVTVTLRPRSVLPGVSLPPGVFRPSATVSMRLEPCASGA